MNSKYEKWQETFGLSLVDDIEPSYLLQSIAEANIIGLITDAEADEILAEYYLTHGTKEQYIQDEIMLRIKMFLGYNNFILSKDYFKVIHGFIFAKTFYKPGHYRDRNISKNEYIIGGESVIYSPFEKIDAYLSYDFEEQRHKRIQTSNKEKAIEQIMPFISNIWQVHPFFEGNTRTTSIFLEKYLRSLGFEISNDIFKDNSVYFRNALVRSNYETSRTLEPTDEYLYKFFYKILLDPTLELNPEEQKISTTRQ